MVNKKQWLALIKSIVKALIFLHIFVSNFSFACSVMQGDGKPVPYVEKVNGYIDKADFVFLGEVKSHEFKRNSIFSIKKDWGSSIKVLKRYKGTIRSSFRYIPQTSCDRSFQNVGEKHIFFGFRDEQSNKIRFSGFGGTITEDKAIQEGIISILEDIK